MPGDCTDSPGHLFLGEAPAVDGYFGVAAVEGEAFGVEVGQGLAGAADQAPGVQVGEARQEFFQGEVQEDDLAQGAQVLHGCLAIDHAAAGGDDVVLAVQEEDEALFRGSHTQVAFLVDDFLQGATFPGLEEEVGIQKAEMGVLGHQHADGALAGAGHADEDEVGGGREGHISGLPIDILPRANLDNGHNQFSIFNGKENTK